MIGISSKRAPIIPMALEFHGRLEHLSVSDTKTKHETDIPNHYIILSAL